MPMPQSEATAMMMMVYGVMGTVLRRCLRARRNGATGDEREDEGHHTATRRDFIAELF
jgi:hypothetical protein